MTAEFDACFQGFGLRKGMVRSTVASLPARRVQAGCLRSNVSSGHEDVRAVCASSLALVQTDGVLPSRWLLCGDVKQRQEGLVTGE